jgi:hypothetical protein
MVVVSVVSCFRLLSNPKPATYGYLIADVAYILASGSVFVCIFSYRNKKSFEEWFWLLMLLAGPCMLISDLYFIPSFGGLIWPRPGGMNTWQGFHLLLYGVACFLYARDEGSKFGTFVLPILMVLVTFTNMSRSAVELSRSAAGFVFGLLFMVVTYYYLIRWAGEKKNYVFCLGCLLFLINNILAVWYHFYVASDISTFCLTWLDKTNTIARCLLTVGIVNIQFLKDYVEKKK